MRPESVALETAVVEDDLPRPKALLLLRISNSVGTTVEQKSNREMERWKASGQGTQAWQVVRNQFLTR